MRISELSRTSGVPVPSIKFYLREGLLPAGRSTGSNQADYGDQHVVRLRLIRALLEIGALSIASAREVIAAVDTSTMPLGHVFGVAQHAISQHSLYSDPPTDRSRRRVSEAIAARGWKVEDDAPARVGAANVLDAFDEIGHPELADLLDDYLAAAEEVAKADLGIVTRQTDVAAMAEIVVGGTVLGDALFAALRRMAQEHVTYQVFPIDPDEPDPFGRGSESCAVQPARSTP